MAEIHVLPSGFGSSNHEVAYELLERAAADGHPLNDRMLHIAALTSNLRSDLQRLEQMVTEFRQYQNFDIGFIYIILVDYMEQCKTNINNIIKILISNSSKNQEILEYYLIE